MNLPPPSPSEAHFIDLSAKFRKFHSDTINVALHFFTTPLGILAVLSLINKVHSSHLQGLVSIYSSTHKSLCPDDQDRPKLTTDKTIAGVEGHYRHYHRHGYLLRLSHRQASTAAHCYDLTLRCWSDG
jgi:hypothetical protein